MDSYIVLQPRSKSNKSDKFRVTKYSEWLAFAFQGVISYNYTEFDTYEEAKTAQDEMNKDN